VAGTSAPRPARGRARDKLGGVLRGALFDLDGTLVHTHIDFGAMKGAVLAIVAEAGVETEPLRGSDSLAIVREVYARLGADEAPRFIARCEAAMVACELAALSGAEEAFDAAAFLGWLRARGVRVGIVTRNSRAAVGILLRRIPLPHDVLLTRDDVPRTKPDPLHLHMALERLGVEHADAIMVGDHHMDIVAGRAAGVRSWAIAHGKLDERAFADCPPHGFLRSFAELRALVPEL
jgi:phosphoglycolate phosphatase